MLHPILKFNMQKQNVPSRILLITKYEVYYGQSKEDSCIQSQFDYNIESQ